MDYDDTTSEAGDKPFSCLLFRPRPYQIEMVQKALSCNCIIKLGTGSGKTFIAIMCIKHYLPEACSEGGRKVVFLVKNVPLVRQQAEQIRKSLFLGHDEVGEYVGRMQGKWIDNWDPDKWQQEFGRRKVLVMTAEIFRQGLEHAKLKLDYVSLLVFDECHHANKNDSYVLISKFLKSFEETGPKLRILGLTACLFNGNIKHDKLEDRMTELEEHLSSKIITTKDPDAEAFRRNSTVKIEVYKSIPLSDTQGILAHLDQGYDHANSVLQAKKGRRSAPGAVNRGSSFFSSSATTTFDSPALKCRKGFTDCKTVLTEVGKLGCSRVVDLYVKEFKSNLQKAAMPEDTQILNFSLQKLSIVSAFCEDSDFQSSPKCEKLVKILAKYYRSLEDKANFRAVIFVEERMKAYAIKVYLDEVRRVNPDICGFIKCEHITGHGLGSYQPEEASMDIRDQDRILTSFRNGDCNVLVATRVIEEGMDVQECSLVIKFDFPKEFRSYIQSRGRARARNSFYYVLIDDNDESTLREKLDYYEFLDEKISDILEKSRILDSEWDDLVTSEVVNYQTKLNAQCNLHNAMQILNRYLMSLRHCSIRPSTALFEFESVGNSFRCSVILPRPCPLIEAINSDSVSSKGVAKKKAAMEAVRRLHAIGELNDHLLPNSLGSNSVSTCSDEEVQERLNYTRKTTNWFDKGVCTFYKQPVDSESVVYYMYRFILVDPLPFSLPVSEQNQFSPVLLFRQSLPNKLISFPIFVGNTYCTTLLQFSNTTIAPSPQQIEILQNVQCVLNSVMLRRTNVDVEFTLNNAFLCAAIAVAYSDSDCICWDFMNELIQESYIIKNPSAIDIVLGYLIQLNAQFGSKSFFYCTGISELSGGKSCRTPNLDSPFYKKISPAKAKSTAGTRRDKAESSFKFDDVTVFKLPVDFWVQLRFLPVSLFRTNQLFLAMELLTELQTYCGSSVSFGIDSWHYILRFDEQREYSELNPDLDLSFEEEFTIRSMDVLHDLSSEARNTLDLTTFLSALTLTHAGDFHNLEVFEIIGDSFLKFIVSTFLYSTTDFSCTESKLSNKRSSMVNNLSLCVLARRKNLQKYVFSQLSVPENYCLGSSIYVEAHHRFAQQISVKSMADVVEGIIGCFLVNCGSYAAKRFLDWLGMDLQLYHCLTAAGHTKFVFQEPKNPFINPSISVQDASDALYQLGLEYDFLTVEEIIRYKFKNQAFLLEALSHPSASSQNRVTDSYQRLEFLGDAVIDYLVTKYVTVWLGRRDISPGKVTDIRSALTNNNLFATIVVKHELHKHVIHFDDRLAFLISEFEKSVNSNLSRDLSCYFNTKSFFDGVNGEITTLKVLGDIFESIIGAVYIDSNYNLEVTWTVLSRLLKQPFMHFIHDTPMDPVRRLHETCSKLKIDMKFSAASIQQCGADQVVKLTLLIKDNNTGDWVEKISSTERNKKMCKIDLASQFLQQLNL